MNLKTILCLLFFLTIEAPCIEKKQHNNRVLDLAHRGYANKNPESSLEAFNYALNYGTDGLEFDIRQTQDGIIVIHHDRRVNELNKNIDELDYKQLTSVKNILTLYEAIYLAKLYNKEIWVEIKDSQYYPSIMKNTVNLLESEGYVDHTVIQSFKTQDLVTIFSFNSKVQLLKLALFSQAYQEIPEYIEYIGLPLYIGFLSCHDIQKIHLSGRKVIYWRDSNFSENYLLVNHLIRFGADGFMLDSPLAELLQR